MAERRRRRGGIWATVAAAAIVGGGLVRPPGSSPEAARAADPPGPAATQPSPRVDPVVPRVGRVARGGGRQAGPITDADRAEAMQFMEKYAPESYKAIAALPERTPQRSVMERGITRAYVNYQQVRLNNADGLYEVIVRRVQAEDRIYGLTVQVRRTPAKDREALTRALRTAVADWFDVSLQERQLRLVRLERTARQERKRLADDNAHQDRRIQERVDRILGDGTPDGDGLPTGGEASHGDGSR